MTTLIAVSWQNPHCLSDTVFVAEAEHDGADAGLAWAQEVVERHKGEMPAGWWPQIVVNGGTKRGYCTYSQPWRPILLEADESVVVEPTDAG